MLERVVSDARALYRAAVRGVQADALLRDLNGPALLGRPVEEIPSITVVAAGKAALTMASFAEASLGDRIAGGVAVVPHGYSASLPYPYRLPHRIETLEAGHPVPDDASADAAHAILDHAVRCRPDDLLLVLLSGGGTALTTAFPEGIAPEEGRDVVRAMLAAGANIGEMNAVRKHLSMLGGGRLAAASPSQVVALVLSDVPGDDLSVIAGGPTVPDTSTFAEAVDVLRHYDLWERVAPSVRDHLERGRAGHVPESPAADDPLFARVTTRLIGSNRTALRAACAEASTRGYAASIVEEPVTGEAREVGARLARELADRLAGDGPCCVLWGGETTVRVTGKGIGGRNQEVALAAALALEGSRVPLVFLSAGTDGVDGPSDAAGAWVTPFTAEAARRVRLDPEAYLARNDSFSFFQRMSALLQPGPTHTNAMDVMIALKPAE
jgi:hydroxypyruvate reductase